MRLNRPTRGAGCVPASCLAFLAAVASANAQEASDAVADPPVAAESAADPAPTADPEPAAEDASEPATDEALVADNEAIDAATDGEATEEEAPEAAEGVDWAGLVERAPEFLAVTHHAAVHLPIALWLFGALFVVIGVVVPSLRNQIPVACLIGGSITSVAAAASGWWYAEYSWGEPWTWADGLGDFDERLVKHRWVGVGLAVASLVLSIVAIVSQVRRSRRLGFVWRLGLIGLALAVAWEGHLGGELIQGEGFLEDAFQAWIDPEAAE